MNNYTLSVRSLLTAILIFGSATVCFTQGTENSPIKIEKRSVTGRASGTIVTRKSVTDANRAVFGMQNISDKAVRGYALYLENGKDKSVIMGLYPGMTVAAGQSMGMNYILTNDDKPKWAFDWVLFADGTAWGPDKHGRSKEIQSFFKGRELAVARTAEILGTNVSKPFFRSFSGAVMHHWFSAIPIKDKEKDTPEEHFNRGYDSIVNALINYQTDGPDADLTFSISQRLRELAIEDPRRP